MQLPTTKRIGTATAMAALIAILSNTAFAFSRDSIDGVFATCSTAFDGPASVLLAFEKKEWALASEVEAIEFYKLRYELDIISGWQKGYLPIYASRLVNGSATDVASLSDEQLINIVLDDVLSSEGDEGFQRPALSPVSVVLKNLHDQSVLLLVSFVKYGTQGWKQKCTLVSQDEKGSAVLLSSFLGDDWPGKNRLILGGKFELPPTSDDPMAVSPKGAFFLINVEQVESTLVTEINAAAKIEISLSIAPPIEIIAKEVQQ